MGDHEMALTLTGLPVPERLAVSNKRAADGNSAGMKAEAVNSDAISNKKLQFDLGGFEVYHLHIEEAHCRK
jgi:hypothetical protein